MKKILVFFFAAVIAVSFGSCTASGYVTERPADVIVNRPPAPGPGYVWVGDDWVYQHGRYVQQQGRWTAPRAGKTYQRGQWVQGNKGYKWQRGHWH